MRARLIKAWVRVCERVCLTLWKFVRICIDCRTDWLKPVGGVRREKKKRDNMPTVCQGRNVSRSEKMYLEQRLPRKESDVGARHTNRNATERSFIKTWRSDICTVYNALSGSHSCVLVNLHALIYGSGNVCIDLKENTA